MGRRRFGSKHEVRLLAVAFGCPFRFSQQPCRMADFGKSPLEFKHLGMVLFGNMAKEGC